MSKIQRFDVYGNANFKEDGSLVLYNHHKEVIAEKDAEIEDLQSQLKASQAIIKEAHDKLVNVNAVSWEETVYEVKELLKIKEVKR